MSTEPVVGLCPNCGASIELDETSKFRLTDRNLMASDLLEEPLKRRQYRLVTPVVCPYCGEEMSFHDAMCYSCNRRSLAPAKRVPHLIGTILVTLPLLEDEPPVEQYLAGAPQAHDAILALIAAVTDLGLRFRATYPNEEISDSGLRHLSADDIWMLELTLDVMCMLAGELAYESQRHDPEILSRSLGNIDKVTHDRHWKRALHQAGAGPAQFQQLRANIPPRTPARR